MKKKVLLLMASALLMLAMVPAAFAADNERPLPETVPSVSADTITTFADAAPLYPGAGTQKDPFIVEISTPEEFQTLATECSKYTGKYYSVTLKNDLDVSQQGIKQPTEWGAYLKYFMGTFDGQGHTITGIPENCYLIYQIHNATIQNINLDLQGKAGTLLYYTFQINYSDGTIDYGENTMSNVTVISDQTIQLTGNDQANYSPFLFATGPYFTMDRCVNKADITGNTYAAVFYGYYQLPLNNPPTDNYLIFKDCVNYGNVNLRYAGLVFGNPTGLGDNRHITIDNMKNYGEIRGTESAHFFSSDAGNKDLYNQGTYYNRQEDKLDPKDSTGQPSLTSPMRQTDEVTQKTGNLLVGNSIDDLGLEVKTVNGQDRFHVVVPTDINPKYTYSVTAYKYVSSFRIMPNGQLMPDGTARISLTEKLSNTDLITTRLEDAPLHDGPLPAGAEIENDSQCLKFYAEPDNNYGYWLDSTMKFGTEHHLYLQPNQQPTTVQWDAYVSVYDENGRLVDTAELSRK